MIVIASFFGHVFIGAVSLLVVTFDLFGDCSLNRLCSPVVTSPSLC